MLRPYINTIMAYNPAKHHRRSIRMPAYDYSQSGAYFVTICTHDRECLFGEVVNDVMHLSACGEIAQACWQAIPKYFPFARLDHFVIMPNHTHGIVWIVEGRGEASPHDFARARFAGDASPLPQPTTPHGTTAGSLSAIVQNFKSVTTRKINQARHLPGDPLWQRNYYERVIRCESELLATRQYILDNPAKWALDHENPARYSQ